MCRVVSLAPLIPNLRTKGDEQFQQVASKNALEMGRFHVYMFFLCMIRAEACYYVRNYKPIIVGGGGSRIWIESSSQTYLVIREDKSVGHYNVCSTCNRETNDLSNVFWC